MAEDHAVLDGLNRSGGDVHGDEARAQIRGEAAQAHQIELKLAQAILRGHIQGLEGLLGDDAGGVDAMASLEATHASLHIGIEDRREAHGLVEIAGHHEALAQGHDAGALGAELEGLARRHALPAAARQKLAILLDGRLGHHHRLLGQQGRDGALDLKGRVRVVFLFPLGLDAHGVDRRRQSATRLQSAEHGGEAD